MRPHFLRKITGTKRNRSELNSMLEFLRSEDTVIVTDLTRLSRSTKDLIEIKEQISQKGVQPHAHQLKGGNKLNLHSVRSKNS